MATLAKQKSLLSFWRIEAICIEMLVSLSLRITNNWVVQHSTCQLDAMIAVLQHLLDLTRKYKTYRDSFFRVASYTSGSDTSSHAPCCHNKSRRYERHSSFVPSVSFLTMDVSQEEERAKQSSSFDRWSLMDDNHIHYGYVSKTGGAVRVTDASSSYYITTAINYTNGPGHMGHAYEATTADVIARYQRSLSSAHAVYFVTGSDEHGQKIAEAAEKEQVSPMDICNKYVNGFQVLNQRLLISYDDYIRTTSARHKRTAQALWLRCANDIYLDTYSGWYNIREETFVTETDAALHNYTDPVSGLPYKRVEEESYFFRMSAYKERLLEYIEMENPNFIQPVHHKNLILQRLKSDELRDLSISRTTFDWGIAVPDGFHDHHVMYVWLDALSNYLTGVDGLGVNGEELSPSGSTTLQRFWPANVHIIGKDILWFHTVIWPCLLFAAGLPPPRAVFAHGFVNDKEGKKMSKSMGNVVDPHDMLDHFAVDTFRWYVSV
jgi:tRNA synthetases class I (M)/tRNA synthetases class I (I, L, M and V)